LRGGRRFDDSGAEPFEKRKRKKERKRERKKEEEKEGTHVIRVRAFDPLLVRMV
jgi:hypothetical protein